MGHYCCTNIHSTRSLLSVININIYIITRRNIPVGVTMCVYSSIGHLRNWIRHDCIQNAIFEWITWHLVNNTDISCHNNHFCVLFAFAVRATMATTTSTMMATIAVVWLICWSYKIVQKLHMDNLLVAHGREARGRRARADNGTIKRLFWHINWLNLWCMGQLQTAFFELYVRIYIYFIVVAVKCQYFNLHPHFHCFGFILLSCACSIRSLLLLLQLTLTICSCLQFWFRRPWMQFTDWNSSHRHTDSEVSIA